MSKWSIFADAALSGMRLTQILIPVVAGAVLVMAVVIMITVLRTRKQIKRMQEEEMKDRSRDRYDRADDFDN